FANELISSCRWSEEISDILIRLVDEFNLGHIYMFKFFVNNIDEFSEAESYEQIFEKFIELTGDKKIELYEFRLYCRDLENKTLLRFSKNINEIGSSGGYIAMEDYSEIPGIQVTPIGQKFISVLK
ncbi:MAG: hypothetical protein L6Q66_06370, partial [Bacteroidia bacterium]|nr:hypothetical protein [Bacteroidia bacterium]